MTKRDILLLAVGLGISFVISGIVYFMLLLATFDLFGIEEIKNPEGRHGKMMLTAVATTLATLAIAAIIRRKNKYAAIGFSIPSLIGITLMIIVGPTYLDKSNYYEPFDRQKWISKDYDRLKMARQLVKSEQLVNLTKAQVIEKLGPGHLEQNFISYPIWGGDCGLEVLLVNDKVSECWIFVAD